MTPDVDDDSADDIDTVLRSIREDAANGRLESLARYAARVPDHGSAVASTFLGARQAMDRAVNVESTEALGPYALLRELGRGGQGVVWLAMDTRLGRKVALKVLTGLGPICEDTVRRFRREAEVASRLNDPGICGVLDAGVIEGVPFIAMQYVEGETLAAKIDRAKNAESGGALSFAIQFSVLSTETAHDVDDDGRAMPTSVLSRQEIRSTLLAFEQAARALHAAHEAGVVHRDVKPGNIMMTNDGRPVILDFGLARADDGGLQTLTQSGDLFGTPAYMSPEQVTESPKRLDRRTDVYSLGATLFECLTLRRPFEAPTREGLYQAILTREAPNVRSLNPDVPVDLAVVVETALDKDLDRRYQTALELAEELRRVQRFEPIVARPASVWTKTVRFVQRNPWVAISGGIAFFGLLSVALALWIKNREITAESRRKDEAITAKNAALDQKDVALKKEQAALIVRTAALEDRRRMSDVKRLANARAEAETFWPIHPDLVSRIESWKLEYSPLFARLVEHERALTRIREGASPYTEAERRRDHPALFAEIDRCAVELRALEAALDAQDDPDPRLEAKTVAIDDRLAELRDQIESAPRTWRFTDDVDTQFLHDTYAQLVSDLGAFVDPQNGVVASVEDRLARSRTIVTETVHAHRDRWTQAIEGIRRSSRYGGVTLAPQIGLIPLGPDPATGCFEFLHWLSHDPDAPLPERNDEGRFPVTAETGILLVLLPGGTFTMGSRPPGPSERSGPNVDPLATDHEAPVHDVTLDPFFIGKHEVTRGQWIRMTRLPDPSGWNDDKSGGRISDAELLRFPVERVDWAMCDDAARRGGLWLPTEAQWEYACRAGAPGAYHFGDAPADLARYGNVADRAYAEAFGTTAGSFDAHDDGHGLVAPVGCYEPNGFGLHDFHGNVWEWCRDRYGPYTEDVEGGTGERLASAYPLRIYRGGSFFNQAIVARATYRVGNTPAARNDGLGFRVAATVVR